MPVVIDQFEIIRDQQKTGDAPAGGTETASASAPTPPPLGPQDIDVTRKQLSARALRLRAT